MNEEVKRQWVDALRSKRYEQGTRVLRSKSNTFCCLGVLCDISGIGEWEEDRSSAPWEQGRYRYNAEQGFFQEVNILPKAVAEWAGVDQWASLGKSLRPKGRLNAMYDTIESLTHANDDGWTFDEIADLIEETF